MDGWRRQSLPCCWLVGILGGLAGCATLPDEPAQRGLYVDLRKSVESSGDTGWIIDRLQVEANAESTMRSVCQVEHRVATDLDAWIGGQIALAGGPPRELYRAAGGDFDAARESLELERTRALLRYGLAHAEQDCPFWLEADPEFAGVEGDAQRFVLLLETRGFGAVFIREGTPVLGAGGGARVLLGHGFGSRVTLAIGGEAGGFGDLASNEEGGRTIDAKITAAVPMLLRLNMMSRVVDFELAPTMRFRTDGTLSTPGLRTNIGYGVSTMRSGSFMPYIVIWLGYEVQPPRDGQPWEHALMIGSRVGVDWDF